MTNNTQHTKRVFAGIRASGTLHLGNYLGSVKGMVDLQNNPDYQTFFMAVDAHGVTTPFDPDELRRNKREIIIDYLAAGLDPEHSVLTYQSLVPQHFELAFYFSSIATVSRMKHLPTFKEKAEQHPEHITMALLSYPVLMAADILLYQAELVPVGRDQLPHLEVAREIARKMNHQYGLSFPEPRQFATSGEYVPSLTGEGKMSKSVPASYIKLTDDLDTIKQRLAGAPTDSGKGSIKPIKQDPGQPRTSQQAEKQYIDQHTATPSPGVRNLLVLVELFLGPDRRSQYERQYQQQGIKYSQLKQELAEAIYQELEPFQQRRSELEADPKYVDQVIEQGAHKAREAAAATLSQVKEKMGLG